jgi:hypothetical protein
MNMQLPDDMPGQLDCLRQDCEAILRQPVGRYFCPLLCADDNDAELCMGHVVNDAIFNSSKKQVVQRKDIDGFYGRMFEADFVTLVQVRSGSPKDAVFNEKMHRKMQPRIEVDGQQHEHYLYRGTRLPPEHTGIRLEHQDGGALDLVLKTRPEDFRASAARKWQIVLERDCRVAAVVSLIKAAYLTLFRMLGYRFALSPGGLEIGRSLLGQFFREQGDKPKAEVLRQARRLFAPFVTLVRPIESFTGTPPHGTVDDNTAMLCFGEYSIKPFGYVVYVRTNNHRHAILVPAYTDDTTAAAYAHFVTNKNEILRMGEFQYHPKDGGWHQTGPMIDAMWPKHGNDLPLDD